MDAEGGLLIHDYPLEPPAEFSFPADRQPLGARYPLFFALTGRAHLAGLPTAVLDSYPYPVRPLLLVGGSPYLSYQDPDLWKRVYEGLDFLAVVDCFLPEEAARAFIGEYELRDKISGGHPSLRHQARKPFAHD